MKTFGDCTSTSSRELFRFPLAGPRIPSESRLRERAESGDRGSWKALASPGQDFLQQALPWDTDVLPALVTLPGSCPWSSRYCPSRYCCWDPSVVHTFQFISTKGEEAKDFDSRAENDEASEPAFVRAHVARSLRM